MVDLSLYSKYLLQSLLSLWSDSKQLFLSEPELTRAEPYPAQGPVQDPEISTLISAYLYTTHAVKCSFQDCNHSATKLENLRADPKQKHFGSEVSSTAGKNTCLIQVTIHFHIVQQVFIKTALPH